MSFIPLLGPGVSAVALLAFGDRFVVGAVLGTGGRLAAPLASVPQAPVVPPPLPFIPPGCLQILLNTPWGEGTLSPFESHRPGLFSVS